MPTEAQAMTWFRTTFGQRINTAIVGTPFTLDLLTAIAFQETGYIWRNLYTHMSEAQVLALCVGDTLDASAGRSAFPKNKAELLAKPNGPRMFQLARQALVTMAPHVSGYSGVAANPSKFCHGFGIFQYDLQFFLTDPQFFLNEHWKDFDKSLGKAIGELKNALKRAYPQGKTILSHNEAVYVAIAYNKGSVNTNGTFEQGHSDNGVYYGENIDHYMTVASQLPKPVPAPAPTPQPAPSTAPATRLIVTKPDTHSPTGLAYQAMAKAGLEGGKFMVDKAEVATFLGYALSGHSREHVIALFNANSVPYLVDASHQKDVANPRIYIFTGNIDHQNI